MKSNRSPGKRTENRGEATEHHWTQPSIHPFIGGTKQTKLAKRIWNIGDTHTGWDAGGNPAEKTGKASMQEAVERINKRS